MARDAELSGNHENAKSCAMFVLKLQKTQTKVQGLLQRFEMMYSMQRLTGVMSNFVQACAKMGFSMDSTINLKNMWKNTAEMDKALSKLDAMSDQMGMVFDTIDSGLNGTGDMLSGQEENDAEAEKLLNDIMGRHNATNFSEQTQASGGEQNAAKPDTGKSDSVKDNVSEDIDELKKRWQVRW